MDLNWSGGRFWFWGTVEGFGVRVWDSGGTTGGQRKRPRGKFTAVTLETSTTHTAVRLPAQRVAVATRKTSGYRRRQGEETKIGETEGRVVFSHSVLN